MYASAAPSSTSGSAASFDDLFDSLATRDVSAAPHQPPQQSQSMMLPATIGAAFGSAGSKAPAPTSDPFDDFDFLARRD